LRAVRLQVARNLDEFLTYAQRLPSGITYDEDGRELPTQLFGVVTGEVTEALPAAAMQAHFDADATMLFNQAVPVSVRKEAARYLMLKYPGTRPYVDEGIGRPTPLHQIDNYRNNWWCALQEKDKETNAAAGNQPGNPLSKMGREPSALDFLTAAQKTAAQAE